MSPLAKRAPRRARSVRGCAGPQPLAGKQVTRLPLRGNVLSHSPPKRAFAAPTGGTHCPRERFARPCGAFPPGPRAARARIPAPIQPRPLLAAPSAASYSRPASTVQGERRHGPVRDRRYTQSRASPGAPGMDLDWGTATSAHHDLHARSEPQAGHRPEHGSMDVRPMSRLTALRGICSGRGCRALQPLRSDEGRFGHGQRAATKGPGAVRRGSPPSGRRGRGSQGVVLLRRSAYPVAEL